jgi:peptidoglycan/xylan/chitin deacetylase (PgdA/CDA1 family)
LRVPSALTVAKGPPISLNVPIIEYHRIVPKALAGNSYSGLVVSPQTFSDQLDTLVKAGWHSITLAKLGDYLRANVRPAPKTFVITIDDGWDDGYTYALPILQKHSFVATYFVVAGRIDHPHNLSSVQLRSLVAAGDEIGDHTFNHVSVAAASPERRTYEVDVAASRIAQVTGRWPTSFAYPFGHAISQTMEVVAACKPMTMAVTETSGAAETWASRFALPRIRITHLMSGAQVISKIRHYS